MPKVAMERWIAVPAPEGEGWSIRREHEKSGMRVARYLWQKDAEHIVALHNAAAAQSQTLEDEPKQIQISGPQCKRCGAFTTYVRLLTRGLCMKCRNEQ